MTRDRTALVVFGGRLALLVGAIAAWELLPRIPYLRANTFLDSEFISLPSLVVARLWETTVGVKAGFLWSQTVATLGAALIGLATGILLGFAMGLALSQSETMRRLLKPFIDAMTAIPPILLVPLITLVFGLGVGSKVATSLYIVFFVVFYNTLKGASAISPAQWDACRILGASRPQLVRTLIVPSALAWAFAALPTAVGYALIGVVVAEFMGSSSGLGAVIVGAMNGGNATDLMLGIVVLGVIGTGLVTGTNWVERQLLHWRPQHRAV